MWREAAASLGTLQVLTTAEELELYVVQRWGCTQPGKETGCRYTAGLLTLSSCAALRVRSRAARSPDLAPVRALPLLISPPPEDSRGIARVSFMFLPLVPPHNAGEHPGSR